MSRFEEMFDDLRKSRLARDETYSQKLEKINTVGTCLYDLFNDKSASYIIPPIRKQTKLALDRVQREVIDLSRKITTSMIRKEYDYDELGVLLNSTQLAVGSRFGPHLKENLDKRIAGVAGVLLHSLKTAFDDAYEDEKDQRDLDRNNMMELEKAVFIQFLKEDSQALAAMKVLAAENGYSTLTAQKISSLSNMLITDRYLDSLKLQLDEIFVESSPVYNLHAGRRNVAEQDEAPIYATYYNLAGPCLSITRSFFNLPGNPQPAPAP
ncbi:MAG: hypothetical protein JWO78_684 [Micavibrio sp.]|nr:hypothetical protein [Micavibrio sp.]